MNKSLHAGAIALACLGALLMYAGWLGLKEPDGAIRAPGPERTFWCGDATCTEAHP